MSATAEDLFGDSSSDSEEELLGAAKKATTTNKKKAPAAVSSAPAAGKLVGHACTDTSCSAVTYNACVDG